MSIQPNKKVRYKANPASVGWLVSIEDDNGRLFIDGTTKLVPLSELEEAPSLVEVSPDQFRVNLTRRRLDHHLTEQLLSYRASRTQLYYHQFLPTKKMLESPDQRLLIADEVGTGKTIEAGLIWAELEARAPYGLENVWVICPKALVGKWQEEMLQRFDLRLEALTPDGLRQALVSLDRDGILPPRFAQSVVNLELIRSEDHVARLGTSAIAWDYVIFDEAHHLRNPETLSHALARFVCERARAAVFLTATPLQTSLDDIVHLMEALGVDVAADPHLLEEQIRWDMELNDCVRILRHRPPGWREELPRVLSRLEESGGRERPGWARLKSIMSEADLDDLKERASVIEAAHDVQVLSPYMTRTMRSDVDVKRPVREAITRVVKFNEAEEVFYREVYKICLVRAESLGVPPGFMTQMPERRTASCAPAVAAEILRQASEAEDAEHAASFSPDEVRWLAPFAQAVAGSLDSKYDALVEILRYLFHELQLDRAIVFSTFRGTLGYLADRLGADGFSLDLLHGGVPARDEDCRPGQRSRERVAGDFRKGKFKVLLASEVAGEGLDFEHCSVVINYDLPWNPMRVEQRIGRCDRIGQRSEKIHIGNLASLGTIEQRILSRLYERLRVFERALGDLEMVLGEEIATFERELFTKNLSPQQQDERLERIAEAIANIDRQRDSIREASDFFLAGRQLIESDQQEIRDSESTFLSSEELAEFVHRTLEPRFPGGIRKPSDAAFEAIGTNDLKESLRSLVRAYPTSHSARGEILRFVRRLEEGRIRLAFTEPNDQAEFIHVRHPLVLLARWVVREPLPDLPFCVGRAETLTGRPTLLLWAIGSLEGYTNRAELLCAAVDVGTGHAESIRPEEALRLVRSLQATSSEPAEDPEPLIALAEAQLLNQFEDFAQRFRARNELLTEKARQAVTSHSERKLRWLDRQLSRSDLKENIRNLYRGWRVRIETETRSELTQLDERSTLKSSLQIVGAALLG